MSHFNVLSRDHRDLFRPAPSLFSDGRDEVPMSYFNCSQSGPPRRRRRGLRSPQLRFAIWGGLVP
jgi:hypothetical protein